MRISQRVENIRRVSRGARNSDRELLIIYMQKSGMELSQKQISILRRMPSFETITRCRRLLRIQGLYTGSKAVEDARYVRFTTMRSGGIEEAIEKDIEAMV